MLNINPNVINIASSTNISTINNTIESINGSVGTINRILIIIENIFVMIERGFFWTIDFIKYFIEHIVNLVNYLIS